MFKVMFVTVRPLLTLDYPNDSVPPLPAVGDELELQGNRYTVVTRVWTIVPLHAVAIYLSQ